MTRTERAKVFLLNFLSKFKHGAENWQAVGVLEARWSRAVREQAIQELIAERKVERRGYTLRKTP